MALREIERVPRDHERVFFGFQRAFQQLGVTAEFLAVLAAGTAADDFDMEPGRRCPGQRSFRRLHKLMHDPPPGKVQRVTVNLRTMMDDGAMMDSHIMEIRRQTAFECNGVETGIDFNTIIRVDHERMIDLRVLPQQGQSMRAVIGEIAPRLLDDLARQTFAFQPFADDGLRAVR